MNNKQFKIVVGLQALILLLFLGTWVCVLKPINVNRICFFTTEAITPDGVHLSIDWSVKYKAPIVLPEELRTDIERKVEIYGRMRIHMFALIHRGETLSKMSVEEIQKQFDDEDVIKEIMKMSPELSRKLQNINSLKLLNIKYEKIFKRSNEIEPILNTVITQLEKFSKNLI